MVRVSNTFLGLLNITSMLLSFVIIGLSIYLGVSGSTECEKFLHPILAVVGIILFLVSLFGLIGSWCRVTPVLWIYMMVVFLLILGMVAFMVFVFFVSNRGAAEVYSGGGYKEYRLGDYGHWLKKHLFQERNWEKIRNCLIEEKVCRSLELDVNLTRKGFYKKNLTPIQSGCCEPPIECGFVYKNATHWTIPKSGPASNNSDCKTWSNDRDRLCYNCESCEAGVLASVKKEWKNFAVIGGAFLMILIAVYTVGCCAYRNNRIDSWDKSFRDV